MAEVPPDRLRDALVRFVTLLDAAGIAYMVVGALAVAVWGRPRATADIDVTVRADSAGLEAIVARARPSGFAIDDEWLAWNPLLRGVQARLTRDAVIVDVMRPRDDHEEAAFERRRSVAIERRSIWLVAPDDLIVMKLKVGRPRDFEDAVAVLAEQRETLDEPYMTRWAERLGIADELAYLLRAGGPA
ncbi:MAG: nucleotidyltransferase [Candidatus Rokubacteria bacterium]|nr:nucleotidyltransferase [Candidatus Rokubacteria bacterium]